jgi:hypothetical protein
MVNKESPSPEVNEWSHSNVNDTTLYHLTLKYLFWFCFVSVVLMGPWVSNRPGQDTTTELYPQALSVRVII